jgi:hypothetical protein
MTITYEELKEVTNNFDGNDFWYWFLTYDQMDNDTKVHILDWFMSEFYPIEGVVEYMQDMGVVKS